MPKLLDVMKIPQVAAIYDDGKILNDSDAEGDSIWDVIVNVGSDDGIAIGQMILIYALGPQIKDPTTGASLGAVEVVRGRGRVTYLQPKMCKVRSAETRKLPRYQQNALSAFAGDRKLEMVDQEAPFHFVRVGDLIKKI